MFFTPNVFASSKAKDVKEGNLYYNQGKFEASIDKYNKALEKDKDSDIINFNVGTALYKNGNYEEAINHLQKSLLTDDKAFQEKVRYNLGLAYYQLANALEKQDVDEAIKSLEKALTQYEKALTINPKDKDAKVNYDRIKKKLEELKKKQKNLAKAKKESGGKIQEDKHLHEENQDKNNQRILTPSNQPSENTVKDQQNNKADQQASSATKEETQQKEGATQEDTGKKKYLTDKDKESQDKISSDQGKDIILQYGKGQNEMSHQEAQMILRDYQENQEPKGLLNFVPKVKEALPVIKDW